MATHAHTRPFRQRWLNALTGIILPLGIFFYIRMLRFRLRLYKDLKTIEKTSNAIIEIHPLTPPCEGGEPIELLSEDNS